VHLSGVDLNLLVVLDALLDHGHVTHAAKRVGLSQSATSHALGRLRAILGDRLFVRSGRSLVATPRAIALREPVKLALEAAGRVLLGPPTFDPRTDRRTFRLGSSDFAELALLPRLMDRLAREAPGVDVVVRTAGADLPGAALARGEVDLVVGLVRPPDGGPAFVEREILHERFVCMMRRGHPFAGKRLTLARYCNALHAQIAPGGKPGGAVDDELARLGRSRRVVVQLPHFLVAPFVIAETDFVLTLPSRIAATMAHHLDVVVVPPPLEVPGFTIAMQWHERWTDDPGHAWLRDTIQHVAKTTARASRR
jgi:DNA-binding transcriptional LysR family regulator